MTTWPRLQPVSDGEYAEEGLADGDGTAALSRAAAGVLEAERVTELEQLGMVWSEQEAAWADGIAVANQILTVIGVQVARLG
ncbi:hypothetical protein OOK39_43255 [Streptomyces sp. NBC_00264]|uniref:hypothetical protein n=1 Tax=unclassified Streptomyces TaxID=2593676 RepID=UPI000F5BAD9A|nr:MULTISPECIES: hypothetical protein [unclassified Streptomyces]WSG48637.1 hypothetical protein OHA38_01790 [Streptomyces sp. NBC_01732]WSW99286.1 hypothetical protein OG355_01895 [Streptomyces sp. NBC_00987]MCX4399265.1 hypothetical protein [Streptomyces sp. NBC_01767]MCX5165476.1 hypothetical protein [Streptomyces sp. NBC_00305]MCX5166130.1 hypothetical protein [Streptomyces sp. NBC_00305]